MLEQNTGVKVLRHSVKVSNVGVELLPFLTQEMTETRM
jgi:hypothetical protein